MAIDMTPEQRTVGEANFKKAADHLGLNRRDFLKAGVLGVGAAGGSAAAVYFGYQSVQGKPVKAALIGGGDEGGVLVGEHNPDFLKFVAVCDIRPSNMKRIFEGDPKVPLRKGFKKVYGARREKDIEKFNNLDSLYTWLAEDKNGREVEAVVIALPLHLHAPVAVKVMQIGQQRGKPIHVLCEKLMAWNIKQCKQMIKTAKDTGSILSIGHQRHYSMVYSQALEVVNSGVLGDVKHIRALWHRNFTWPYTHDPKMGKQVPGITPPRIRDGWFQPVLEEDYEALRGSVKSYGYDSVEQLIRWRLYAETGGGLMAELGSHQLDACSIFLGKVHPLAVQGFGGKLFFGPGKNDRNIDDHVFVTYEFPGKNHPANPHGKGTDKNDIVVMTYSSISTNGFEAYGECLMGSRGTMVVEAEQRVMLYTEKDPTQEGRPADDGGERRDAEEGRTGGGGVLDVGRSGGGAGGGGQGRGGGERPGEPGLPRGDGGLRLLRADVGPEGGIREERKGRVQAASAEVPRRGGDGGRDCRAVGEPGDAREAAHRVRQRLVQGGLGGGPRRSGGQAEDRGGCETGLIARKALPAGGGNHRRMGPRGLIRPILPRRCAPRQPERASEGRLLPRCASGCWTGERSPLIKRGRGVPVLDVRQIVQDLQRDRRGHGMDAAVGERELDEAGVIAAVRPRGGVQRCRQGIAQPCGAAPAIDGPGVVNGIVVGPQPNFPHCTCFSPSKIVLAVPSRMLVRGTPVPPTPI